MSHAISLSRLGPRPILYNPVPTYPLFRRFLQEDAEGIARNSIMLSIILILSTQPGLLLFVDIWKFIKTHQVLLFFAATCSTYHWHFLTFFKEITSIATIATKATKVEKNVMHFQPHACSESLFIWTVVGVCSVSSFHEKKNSTFAPSSNIFVFI